MPLCHSCGAINDAQTATCKKCKTALSPEANTIKTEQASNDRDILENRGGNFSSQGTLRGAEPVSPPPPNGTSSPHETEAKIPSGHSAVDQFSGERPDWEDSPEQLDQGGGIGLPPDGPINSPSNGGNLGMAAEYLPRYFGLRPPLVGRVFVATERPAEPPDFDPWLWISRFLAITLIMGLLFLSWEEVFRRLGILAIGGLVGFFWLVSRSRGMGMLFIVAVLGLARLFGAVFRRPQELLPVRICRLMDDQGREHIVRIKGRIIRGDVDQEDRVAVWGRRRHRTWLFRRGFNIRPQSWVLVEGSYTWITTLLLALLNFWLGWKLSTVHPEWFF